MTQLPIVLHLVDDVTAGGVMRVVDHIMTSPDLAATAQHSVLQVPRGKVSTQKYDADLIVSHLSISWRNLPLLIAARAANASTRLVHVEHSYTEAFVALNVKHRARFAALLKTAFSLFDQVVAVSHAQAAWIASRGYCRANKIVTIQSCVDLSAFRAMPAPKGRSRIFAAIGRLDTQKGFDTLIEAFKQRSSDGLELHIYGEGNEELALRNLAAGDQGIVFKGWAADPLAAFSDADVVLMPSRWEAYGLVAVEGLSAGRQVFCSNTDGLRDHADAGAILVSGRTASAWTAVIEAAQSEARIPHQSGSIRVDNVLERRFSKAWSALVRIHGLTNSVIEGP
jgi:D-inositol-3-phosphate glycosyltransferase